MSDRYRTGQFEIPVLLVLFNRPDLSRNVISAIRCVGPKKLFVAADGPRVGRPSDPALCEEARAALKLIDWPCEIKTLFRDKNLGCRRATTGALTWMFQYVDRGIMLEDDSMPHPDFFNFCAELLARYENNERIMSIGGCNFQFGSNPAAESYYFSRLPGPWGMATWARAWSKYDDNVTQLKEFKRSRTIDRLFSDPVTKKFWMFKIEDQLNGPDTWSFSWIFSLFVNDGLHIIPAKNLVSNTGFGKDSIRARDAKSRFSNIPVERLGPLIHPEVIAPFVEADEYFTRLLAKEQLTVPRKWIPKARHYTALLLRSIFPEWFYVRIRACYRTVIGIFMGNEH